MLFMLVSRTKPGTTRQQVIERLTRELHPETWDLVRHGVLSHIYYRVGEDPGFFALLHAPSLEEAKKLVANGVAGFQDNESTLAGGSGPLIFQIRIAKSRVARCRPLPS